MIVEPSIKSNFERGFAKVDSLDSNTSIEKLIQEKTNALSETLKLESEIKALKKENEDLRKQLEQKQSETKQDKKSKKGGE